MARQRIKDEPWSSTAKSLLSQVCLSWDFSPNVSHFKANLVKICTQKNANYVRFHLLLFNCQRYEMTSYQPCDSECQQKGSWTDRCSSFRVLQELGSHLCQHWPAYRAVMTRRQQKRLLQSRCSSSFRKGRRVVASFIHSRNSISNIPYRTPLFFVTKRCTWNVISDPVSMFIRIKVFPEPKCSLYWHAQKSNLSEHEKKKIMQMLGLFSRISTISIQVNFGKFWTLENNYVDGNPPCV